MNSIVAHIEHAVLDRTHLSTGYRLLRVASYRPKRYLRTEKKQKTRITISGAISERQRSAVTYCLVYPHLIQGGHRQ